MQIGGFILTYVKQQKWIGPMQDTTYSIKPPFKEWRMNYLDKYYMHLYH